MFFVVAHGSIDVLICVRCDAALRYCNGRLVAACYNFYCCCSFWCSCGFSLVFLCFASARFLFYETNTSMSAITVTAIVVTPWSVEKTSLLMLLFLSFSFLFFHSNIGRTRKNIFEATRRKNFLTDVVI